MLLFLGTLFDGRLLHSRLLHSLLFDDLFLHSLLFDGLLLHSLLFCHVGLSPPSRGFYRQDKRRPGAKSYDLKQQASTI